MINAIIRFSIRHKLIIGLFTLILIVFGLWGASRLAVDAVPDITNNQVQVITLSPTLAAQETEQLVTAPIEKALANLPNLVEMRSISRFGLSVVTVVFEESVNINFARTLINEKLLLAVDDIPKGVSRPELAPLSTGLGEVYQYILHPTPAAEKKYSAMDLRTMQDWIVARQLYGTEGVAEVNSFGGLLKQYEVAVNTNRLQALQVTMEEIFTALEKNNENTGGAYIDKKPYAYFIRGVGLVNSLEDVGNIVIKKVNGIPVLIKHVAEPRLGSAIRYGAVSYNGEKEIVGGIVMMLKGANSAQVVERVKAKMATIQNSLPDDVVIEPYLDRTSLVDRAMNTVKTNLVEGALIVIFVLVVFLGNLRAGLIVASAIPLSMLFALAMMHVFGIGANLMSLGAIDFGLIVDGAVIIVEATLHHLSTTKRTQKLSQTEMDEEVYTSSSEIMNSAVFGGIIILIVYIPILSLVGIEGKMFRPMAQTVGLAILGAIILSLTYIPMMAALVLPKQQSKKVHFSDKLMAVLVKAYLPALRFAIRFKYAVIGLAIGLLALSILIFSRMGGEFIPQMQEGDYAFHCILPQGSSLSQSVETSMQASRILRSFPEVKMVVAKTGTAEIPTDVMPPEATDVFIILKPIKEWTTTRDYDELANMMIEKLQVIPGVFFEINQPIQMRFNELMTGVRQDVAVKIFGENIDTLAQLANKVSSLVSEVNGVMDPQVERITGLPQITIDYNREAIAAYGLSIQDLSSTISAAFAGAKAGVVYENERRFDLVVRLDSASRTSMEDVNDLMIAAHEGVQVPLSQLATVSLKEGPAQISRDEGKRRIVVGFNVRGRDVQSVVTEIQTKLNEAKILPVGYYYTYGGTFENLQKASARLKLAVPFALILIFLLLYFSFGSVKEALLIYTAIPMSAIGGIFALLIRGMPFSISAGVGFIALFGVAVLNGIVLIHTFNQLEKKGMTDVLQRVHFGAVSRLRPVLMTAMVASLGFIPMALSTGAGAEVQKPLATVVIGGLISATFLTLVVLPLLYILFQGRKLKSSPKITALLIFSFATFWADAQSTNTRRLQLEEALEMGNRNLQYGLNDLEAKQAQALIKSANALPKTGFFVENEDARPSDPAGILKVGVSQTINWPGLYRARAAQYKASLEYTHSGRKVLDVEMKQQIRSVFYQLWYYQEQQQLYMRLDSTYRTVLAAARVKVISGERPPMDSMAARLKSMELASMALRAGVELKQEQVMLKQLLQSEEDLLPPLLPLEKIQLVAESKGPHPELALQAQKIQLSETGIAVLKNENKPEFSGRFFSQRLWGRADPFSGFSVSAAFPLFGASGYRQKVNAAQAAYQLEEKRLEYQNQLFDAHLLQARQETEKQLSQLRFYEETGLKQAAAIINSSTQAYRAGEISYGELAQYLTEAIQLNLEYYNSLNNYNQAVIRLLYFQNN